MGIGEPMLNINNLIKALYFISDNDYFGMAQRHITVSTSGIVKGIYNLADTERQYNLAVSLHGPTDDLRARLIPDRFRDSITDIIDACKAYRKKTTRMVTFEYTLMSEINDSPEIAQELVDLFKSHDMPAKINLIPFNPYPGTPYKKPSNNRIHRFKDVLHANGYIATIRKTRGDDIDAACGQLAGNVLDRTRRKETYLKTMGKHNEN
jgi:23S rRNA (adenine2503-C2)-methyltransferase